MRKRIRGIGLSIVLLAGTASAVPNDFAVQGVLRDNTGRLQSMMIDVTATLYDAETAGNKLAGPYGPMKVMVTNGLYSVILPDANLKTELAGASAVWLEVVAGTAMYSRQRVTSEIYAILAGSADEADKLSPACSGCVLDAMIKGVDGGKVSGKVPSAVHADTVTNGVYTTGTYADPAWLTSLDGSKIVNALTGATVPGANVTGKVAAAANADMVTNGVYTSGTYADPVWITSLAGAKITGTVASATTAAGFSGALAGDVTGTQSSTTVAALRGTPVAAGTPAAGQVLQFDSVRAEWIPSTLVIPGGTVTRVTAGAGLGGGTITTSGTIFVAAGGIAPSMLSAGSYAIDITGNAATVTSGVYINGSYSDPSFITSLSGSKITGAVANATNAGNATTVTNGVYTNGSYPDPAFITSLSGSKITGAVANATNAINAGNATTVTNGVYTNGSYPDPAFITSLSASKIVGAVASAVAFTGALAGDVTGTQAATRVVALHGSPLGATVGAAVGAVLAFNGTRWMPGAGGVTVSAGSGLGGGGAVALGGAITLTNAGVLGVGASAPLASSGGQNPTIALTGVVPVANGGTGSATQNFVDLSSAQTVSGAKTFTSALVAAGLSDINNLSYTVVPSGNSTLNNLGVGALGVGANGGGFFTNQGGSLELGGGNTIASQINATPFIDFHFGTGAVQDFNARIINDADNQLSIQSAAGSTKVRIDGGTVWHNGAITMTSVLGNQAIATPGGGIVGSICSCPAGALLTGCGLQGSCVRPGCNYNGPYFATPTICEADLNNTTINPSVYVIAQCQCLVPPP